MPGARRWAGGGFTLWLGVAWQSAGSRGPQIRQLPGLAILHPGQPAGFSVPDDFFGSAVPPDLLAGAVGNIAEVGEGGNPVADLEIEHRLLPGLDAVQEVPHMSRARVAIRVQPSSRVRAAAAAMSALTAATDLPNRRWQTSTLNRRRCSWIQRCHGWGWYGMATAAAWRSRVVGESHCAP